MTETLKLPVLPLSDSVVLPGMVVPLRLDEAEIQSAVDAASSADRKVLVVPRLDGKYAAIGTVAVLEQIGRLPAASRRRGARCAAGPDRHGRHRPRRRAVGGGHRPAPATAAARSSPATTRPWSSSILQQRGAWQVIDSVAAGRPTRGARRRRGYASWLDLRGQAPAARDPDVAERLELLVELGRATTWPSSRSPRRSATTSARAWRRPSASSCCASSSRPSARSSARASRTAPTTTAPASRRPTCPSRPEAALREVDKLERTSDQSPEAGWIRTWLDTVLELPWNERTEDTDDISAPAPSWTPTTPASTTSRNGSRVPGRPGPPRRARPGGGRRPGLRAVLALVGPPGVGKTSLGESVARALGRKFVRVALGGVRDEAEIRGHRRTYVGALPGRIVRAIKEAGSMNPVVLLDEIDKVGSDYRRRPGGGAARGARPGAEPHVPRPLPRGRPRPVRRRVPRHGQRAETIPGPLLDRMEVVTLDGYTEDEKVAIARDHLLPRQLERAGWTRRRGRRHRRGAAP